MTLTLELAPGQEAEVHTRAAQSDPDADAYLAALVRYALDVYTLDECGPPLSSGDSAYDAMKDLIGAVDSGDGRLSEDTGGRFTEVLRQKKRQRRF
ncbi:MAG: hypothetical protein M3Y28_08765 [Armatimonadota bacterium]|nr:hypothetical protein [Armatimonadota bacterium]